MAWRACCLLLAAAWPAGLCSGTLLRLHAAAPPRDRSRDLQLSGSSHKNNSSLSSEDRGGPLAAAALPGAGSVPRRIWLLWWQGWAAAPRVVQTVAESWRRHNPTWVVIQLDRSNMHQHIDMSRLKRSMTRQALSDMVRLTLLSSHGGVWADATVLCMESLDTWLWEKVLPAGIWMYKVDQGKMGVASSWFIAAGPGSYIIQSWRKDAEEYWQGRTAPTEPVGGIHEWFWMNGLFLERLRRDSRFRKEWETVPRLDEGVPCGPHMLHDTAKQEVNLALTSKVRQCVDLSPPHVLKLTWRSTPGQEVAGTGSNGHYAISKSLGSLQRVSR